MKYIIVIINVCACAHAIYLQPHLLITIPQPFLPLAVGVAYCRRLAYSGIAVDQLNQN